MAGIAFILLCHKDPAGVVEQAEQLTAVGDYVAIHFDANASKADYREIQDALSNNANVTFARKRVRCGWGEWSLVQATLNAVKAAEKAFPRATHFYMISGDCAAIKSARFAHQILDRDDVDYIESFDFFESGWIKTGIQKERLIYRHFFNERKQKSLFYRSIELQQKLGLERKIPPDLQIMIGSQWWCLRRRTVEAILALLSERPDIIRFFRTTWIPDETFFQTLVAHLVPQTEIRKRTLTFLMFTDYGMPVTFYNDHYDLLVGQDYLFARKISPMASELTQKLNMLWASDEQHFDVSDEGPNLHRFLVGRGRVGRRFAPRFWETEGTMGRDRELMIVVCKKWHVAKRLVECARQVAGITAVDYLFNEEATPIPDLGGIQNSLEKRMRHRRALLRMLFAYYQTDRMAICLDTANIDLVHDFFSDRTQVRLLEIECQFSDEYLIGHAMRVGLAGEQTTDVALNRLLPTIRYDINYESDQLRDAGFSPHYRIRETGMVEQNAKALEQFFSIETSQATEISKTKHLFVD